MRLQFALPITLSLLFVALLFEPADQPGRDALVAVALAATGAIATLLLVDLRPRPARVVVADVAVAALAVGIVLVGLPAFAVGWLETARLVTAVFVVTLPPVLLLRAAGARAEALRPVVITIFATLLATPIWLGPAIEWAGNPAGPTLAVVALSPLTAFAAALEIDLLRTYWFYAQSPLGSMRYGYPAWFAYVAVLGGASLAILFIQSRVKRQ